MRAATLSRKDAEHWINVNATSDDTDYYLDMVPIWGNDLNNAIKGFILVQTDYPVTWAN